MFWRQILTASVVFPMNTVKTLTFITTIVIHIYVVVSKPLQQNSNDRLLDYDQQNNNNDENSDVGTVSPTLMMDDGVDDDTASSSPSAMDKLKKATEAVNEFRQMLNERILFMNGGKTGENFKFSGALPSRQQQQISTNGDDVVAVGKRTEQHSRRKHHRQHTNHRKQQLLYQRDTVSDSMNSANGNVDDVDDAISRGGSSLANAFKINANLYRSPAENTQNYMATGRESETRFNLASDLFASPLGKIKFLIPFNFNATVFLLAINHK